MQQTTVTSGFALDVSGAVWCTALTQTSDGNLKTVLGPSLGLDFILKLNPVAYRWNCKRQAEAVQTAQFHGMR